MKTTKSILLLSIAIFASTTVRAQFVKDVGIKVGATISNIRLTDVTPVNVAGQLRYLDFVQGNVVNPSVSLFANLLNIEHFSLQTDLTYLRKGASKTYEVYVTTEDNPDGPGTLMSYTSEFSLQYLEFAMMAQPRQSLGEIELYAEVGPTASYLLTAANFAPISDLSRFQVGYTIGVGADLGRVLNSNLFIEIRYLGDFRYFYDHPHAKMWHRSWMFCFGTTLSSQGE